MQVVERFTLINLADNLIERIELDLRSMHCSIFLSGASLLKEDNPNIFDPAERYQRLICALSKSVPFPVKRATIA
jgi:hypothetical protein